MSVLLVFLLASNFIGNAKCQFNLLLLRDDSFDQTLHSQYIKAAVDFLNLKAQTTILNLNDSMVDPNDVESIRNIICELLTSQTNLVINMLDPGSSTDLVKNISGTSGVPVIHIVDDFPLLSNVANKQPTSFTTFLTPNTFYLNVLKDATKKLKVTGNVFILYDSVYLSDNIVASDIVSKQQLNAQFALMANDKDDVISQMNDIQQQNIATIFFLSALSNAEKYLFNTADFMAARNITWFIFTNDHSPFVCIYCHAYNTLWFHPQLDTSDGLFQEFLDEILNPYTLNAKHLIVPYDKMTLSFYLNIVSIANNSVALINDSLPSGASYSCSTPGVMTDKLTLKEVIYEVEQDTSRAFGAFIEDAGGRFYQDTVGKAAGVYFDGKYRDIENIGSWSLSTGFYDMSSTYVPRDPSQIRIYRIAVAVRPPFVELYNDTDGNPAYRGYCIDMIVKISEIIGFKYILYQVDDNKYGSLSSTGDWNGIIREIVFGDADMGLSAIPVTSDRENYVDMTVPYYELMGNLILMKNSETSTTYFEFMTVLTPNVWLSIVAAFFVTSFFLWLFDKYSPYGKHEKKKYTFKQSMWYCLTTLIPQGGPDAPKNSSCKVVAATWWLFGFVIISAYTANLAAYLTLNRMQLTITSLDDLSKQYKYRYGGLRGSEQELYVKRMMQTEKRFYNIWQLEKMALSQPPHQRAGLAIWDYPVSDKFTNMWRFMTDDNFVHLPKTIEEALKLVLESNDEKGFAYIGESAEIKYIVMTDCRFQAMGNEFDKMPFGIALQQRSWLRETMSDVIMNLTRDGWLPDLKEKWWANHPKNAKCGSSEDTQSQAISVMNIFGVFLVVGALAVVAVVTLVFEFLYYEEKVCVRNYRKHHDPHHSLPAQASQIQDGDIRKNNMQSVFDVQRMNKFPYQST